MKKKKVLITGITGQDGSYLAEYLLSIGYEVHGIVRRVALEDPTHHFWRLQKVLDQYLKLYTMANELPPFWATIPRIQRYDKKGHFNHWHFERGGNQTINRCLVYMTYLNDVEEGGETDFLYQKKSFQPRTGKTLIWPSDWTHTHRGQISQNQEKYIITGWFNFIQ